MANIPEFLSGHVTLPFPLRRALNRVGAQLDVLIYDALAASEGGLKT
jgi:hypothetical protein